MTTDTPKTLLEAVRYFSSLKVCFETMLAVKWPEGNPACPKCGEVNVGRIETRDMYVCRACLKQFSLRAGTIFGDSKLSLSQWFVAVWCVANGDEVSSQTLAKALGITQKSAWFLLNRIRIARQLTHKRVK